MTGTQTSGSYIRKTITALIALWFLAAPVYSLLGKGPFDWHIKQPAAWQGGAEILALVAIFYVAQALREPRWRIGVAVLAAWLVSRRHGVDISIVLVYLYAEGIFALGWWMLRRLGVRLLPRPSTMLLAALCGVVVWSLVIWIASALGFGSLEVLRFIAVAVLGLAIALGGGPRIATLATRAFHAKRPMDRLAIAFLGAFFIALFAKASVMLDYDSVWYGLQAEEVLVGEGNLYKAQALASVAHYYPKLYEALELPFAGLGSVSLIFGLSIFSWALVVLSALAILREFHVERTLRLWGAAAIATLPALASIAVTAKGDAFSAWLLLMGVLGLVRYRKGLGGLWMWVAASAVLLGVQARLANLPYAAILMLVLAYSVVRRWRMDGGIAAFLNKGLGVAIATTVLSALITARSLLLAGVVLVAPNSVVEMQRSLGLEPKYPIGLLPPDEGLPRLPILDGLWGILFDPARYPHLIITWIGNVWMFLPIAVAVLGIAVRVRAKPGAGTWPLLAMGLAFFAVMFGYKLLVPAGDGNYFIVPLACLALWGVVLADNVRAGSKRYLGMLLASFAFFAAAISFVTGSWGPGTRGFDRVMTRVPLEYAARAKQGLAAARLEGVARFFTGMSPGTRVIGLDTSDVNVAYPIGWWLPVRYEALQPYAWQQPDLIVTAAAFQQYLREGSIEYVIAPKKRSPGPIEDRVRASLDVMQAGQAAQIAYEDSEYVVWRILKRYGARTRLSSGGKARIDVDDKLLCTGNANTIATVTWSGASSNVAIEVKPPGGVPALWAEAGTAGSLQTGPWVGAGAEFIFKLGRDGQTIGRLSVEPRCAR